jgi:hypothetical protein
MGCSRRTMCRPDSPWARSVLARQRQRGPLDKPAGRCATYIAGSYGVLVRSPIGNDFNTYFSKIKSHQISFDLLLLQWHWIRDHLTITSCSTDGLATVTVGCPSSSTADVPVPMTDAVVHRPRQRR